MSNFFPCCLNFGLWKECLIGYWFEVWSFWSHTSFEWLKILALSLNWYPLMIYEWSPVWCILNGLKFCNFRDLFFFFLWKITWSYCSLLNFTLYLHCFENYRKHPELYKFLILCMAPKKINKKNPSIYKFSIIFHLKTKRTPGASN